MTLNIGFILKTWPNLYSKLPARKCNFTVIESDFTIKLLANLKIFILYMM